MTLVYAILLGTLFGYVLVRIGATNADKIIGMLTLRDMHLAKAIGTATGLSSALLFLGIASGVIDAGHMSIKAVNAGVVAGGALFGIGWALSGYCPGSGVTALGAGRKDAWFFVLGGLAGAGLFTLLFAGLKPLGLFDSLLGGKVTLAGAEHTLWLPLLLGAAMILGAWLLPQKLRD